MNERILSFLTFLLFIIASVSIFVFGYNTCKIRNLKKNEKLHVVEYVCSLYAYNNRYYIDIVKGKKKAEVKSKCYKLHFTLHNTVQEKCKFMNRKKNSNITFIYYTFKMRNIYILSSVYNV